MLWEHFKIPFDISVSKGANEVGTMVWKEDDPRKYNNNFACVGWD